MDLGQVFTNKTVAEYMVSMFELGKDALILDPCFGAGAFLTAGMLQGFTNIEGYEIDEELYEKVKKQFSQFKLYNKDFLKVSNTRKYDGIIMNPPYIRQEKIDDLEKLGITKNKLRKNKIYEQLPSTANMYMYFIFKALDLLKVDGEMVVIFPSSWMDARSGKAFQMALNSRATIIKQVHISGEVFEKSALVEVVILKLKKGSIKCKSQVEYLEARGDSICEVLKAVDYEDIEFDIPFSKYASVRRGLTTGYNAMYINPAFKKNESKVHLVSIISSPKSIVGYETKDAAVDNLLYVQDGENIPDTIFNYPAEGLFDSVTEETCIFVGKVLQKTKEVLVYSSDMTTVFYQLDCEIQAKVHAGVRKQDMRDIIKTYVPKVDLITKEARNIIKNEIPNIVFLNLSQPQIRKIDKIWAEILFGSNSEKYVTEAQRLLRFLANRRNPQ